MNDVQDEDGVGVAVKGMYKTIKYPQVWKPSLYMFISLALNISTHEGYFYWYTDPKAGPAFSQVGFTVSHCPQEYRIEMKKPELVVIYMVWA